MPIFTSFPITVFDQESFHRVDKIVTGHAFDIHNEMGRYLDERLYQGELAARLQHEGLGPVREMKITVTLDGFTHPYYVDVLIEGGVIVETKTAEALSAAHRAQVLSYLYLCGLHHATLLNFRTTRVQHEFVSTQLNLNLRRQVTWDLSAWEPCSPGCSTLHDTLRRAVADWGVGLDTTLYRDAVTHFLGGEASVIRDVEITSAHGKVGTQKIHTLAPDLGFSITASARNSEAIREHHRRFLKHSSLRQSNGQI